MTRAIGLREQHKQSTRHALVDAALRLFDERGYGEVTVEDICSQVAVSPRTFFRYFPTKEQVLAEPITALLDVLREELRAQPPNAPVWPSLQAAVRTALATVDDDSETFLRTDRVVKQAPNALASNARAFTEWELSVRGEISDRLGVQPGELAPRLLLGVAMVAVRASLEQWADSKGAGSVLEHLDRALAAVDPGARAIAAGD